MVISVGVGLGKLKQRRNDKRPNQLQKLPRIVSISRCPSPRFGEMAIVSLGQDPFSCSFSRLLGKKRQRNKQLDLSWKFFVM